MLSKQKLKNPPPQKRRNKKKQEEKKKKRESISQLHTSRASIYSPFHVAKILKCANLVNVISSVVNNSIDAIFYKMLK